MRLKQTIILNGFYFHDGNDVMYGFYYNGRLRRYTQKNNAVGCSIIEHIHGNKRFFI